MKKKIAEDAEKQFVQQSDQKLLNDVTEYLVDSTKFELPAEFLQKTSNNIINKVKGVNRVVYDISSKPPATIEWE